MQISWFCVKCFVMLILSDGNKNYEIDVNVRVKYINENLLVWGHDMQTRVA